MLTVPPTALDKLTTRASSAGVALKVLAESRIIKPYSPVALARAGKALKDYGTGPAGGFLAMAALLPDKPWVVDEDGERAREELAAAVSALDGEATRFVERRAEAEAKRAARQ